MQHAAYDAHPRIGAVGDAAWTPRRIGTAAIKLEK